MFPYIALFRHNGTSLILVKAMSHAGIYRECATCKLNPLLTAVIRVRLAVVSMVMVMVMMQPHKDPHTHHSAGKKNKQKNSLTKDKRTYCEGKKSHAHTVMPCHEPL